MPMFIKIDVKESGKVWAWVNDSAEWSLITSKTSAFSVPQLLRKLAKAIQNGSEFQIKK